MHQRSEINFDVLFANTSFGIIIANEQGMIIRANPFLLEQFNYSKTELKGRSIEKLFPLKIRDGRIYQTEDNSKIRRELLWGQETDISATGKDGSIFSVKVSLRQYATGQGKFIIVFSRDISNHRNAKETIILEHPALQVLVEERTLSLLNRVKQLEFLVAEAETNDYRLNRTNNFLKNIWDNAVAIIFATNKQGIIKMVNKRAELKLGYTSDEIVDQVTPVVFFHEQDRSILTGESAECAPAGNLTDFSVLSRRADMDLINECEVTYVCKDRSVFPVSLSITAMRNDDGMIEGYLCIALEISKQKKAERELILALEKEKELSELKSRFISIASHEFRTPLSTVLSSAYLISKYTTVQDNANREKHVNRIINSVNMLTNILNDFLSVGKLEEGKIQVHYTSFNIEQHIKSTINDLSDLQKNGQTVHYVHSGPPVVALDSILLKHITINLLANAIKFSGEGGRIELYSQKTDKNLTFTIKDYGIGISEADQSHLFDRFFRGENVTHIQGTGLGLHIVHKYIELLNGTIRCESELHSGTTFKITFIN